MRVSAYSLLPIPYSPSPYSLTPHRIKPIRIKRHRHESLACGHCFQGAPPPVDHKASHVWVGGQLYWTPPGVNNQADQAAFDFLPLRKDLILLVTRSVTDFNVSVI